MCMYVCVCVSIYIYGCCETEHVIHKTLDDM